MCAVESAGGSAARARKASASREGGCRAIVGSGPCGCERCGAEPEEAVARAGEPLCKPRRALLRTPVLGEPPRELLRGSLGLELGELRVLVGEEPARLELEERRDQDEELTARVEVEPVALCEPLHERDHDLGQVELARAGAPRAARA